MKDELNTLIMNHFKNNYKLSKEQEEFFDSDNVKEFIKLCLFEEFIEKEKIKLLEFFSDNELNILSNYDSIEEYFTVKNENEFVLEFKDKNSKIYDCSVYEFLNMNFTEFLNWIKYSYKQNLINGYNKSLSKDMLEQEIIFWIYENDISDEYENNIWSYLANL